MAKCIKAQPQKKLRESKIGIAEVLIALRKNKDLLTGISIYPTGEIITANQYVDDEPMIWNLENDDINQQSPEVIEFLRVMLFTKAKDI